MNESVPDGVFENRHVAETFNEKKIVEAFEHVFDETGIGLFDDFVRLGGDSVKAIRIISFLRKNGIDCNAQDILIFKTPYLIAKNVR